VNPVSLGIPKYYPIGIPSESQFILGIPKHSYAGPSIRRSSTQRSTLVEQSTPSSHVIVDEFASVSNVLFTATRFGGMGHWFTGKMEPETPIVSGINHGFL